jgi:hypothetical protein
MAAAGPGSAGSGLSLLRERVPLARAKEIAQQVFASYWETTEVQLKAIDLFLVRRRGASALATLADSPARVGPQVFVLATGLLQLLYAVLVGQFPFNSLLAGVISCVGTFVLTGERSSRALPCGTHAAHPRRPPARS